jgi:hypothetical protein
MTLFTVIFICSLAATTVISQSSFPPTSTFPPTTTRFYCTLNCGPYPNTYENYQTCRCECLVGYYVSPNSPGCISFNTNIILTTISQKSTWPQTTYYFPKQAVEVLTTTTVKKCDLNCRSGFLISNERQCECLCYEFYAYNGKTCLLSNLICSFFKKHNFIINYNLRIVLSNSQ